MKKFFIYTVIVGFLLILYGCPTNFLHECTYEVPINVKNLKDTIKTTDTLWVENDFDAHFCSENAVFRKEHVIIIPTPMKLINDSLVSYNPMISAEGNNEGKIKIRQQNGIYELKYGIVFPDTGIYAFGSFKEVLYEERTDVLLSSYFDVPDNNAHLLPEKLRYKTYITTPYRYYFLVVVE